MKKTLLTCINIFLGLMLVSCEKDGILNDPNSPTIKLDLKINLEGSVANAPQENNTYYIEVYSDKEYTKTSNLLGGAYKAKNNTGIFPVEIHKDSVYYFLFWANSKEDCFNTTNLKEVKVNDNKNACDAWQGKGTINKTAQDYTFNLKRVVTKLTLFETGILQSNSTLKVSFTGDSGFNVASGLTVGKSRQYTYSFEFKEEVNGSSTPSKINSEEIHSLFSSEQEGSLSMNFITNSKSFDIKNIKIKRNQNTNISGHFTHNNINGFSITTDQWENQTPTTPDHKGIKLLKDDGGNGAPLYEISTAEGLIRFRDIINGKDAFLTTSRDIQLRSNAILAKDIDLSTICSPTKGNWSTIADNLSYSGTFDGNGKSIKNIYINNTTNPAMNKYSLFGRINKGEIKNLTVTGEFLADITGIKDWISAGGISSSISDSKITNCHSAVNMNLKLTNSDISNGGITAGGIVASAGQNSEIKDCTSSSTITAEFQAPPSPYALSLTMGGIVGSSYEIKTITNCRFTGNISGKSNNYIQYVGGITGQLRSSTMFGCMNHGSINLLNGTSVNIGGLAGYADKTTADLSAIAASYNAGNITISKEVKEYLVGGITGSDYGTFLNGCFSTGNITNNANAQAKSYIGGICGEISPNWNDSYASNCWYISSVEIGKNGIGKAYKSTLNSDGGHLSQNSLLNNKVNSMNAAIDTYNQTAKEDWKCKYRFAVGSNIPTITY